MNKIIDSPVSIITGAGTGIGFQIALRLLNQGQAVVLNDHDENALTSAKKQINELCPDGLVEFVHGDAGDIEHINALINVAMTRFGRIDNAIANAGTTTFGKFLDYKPEQLDQLLSLNIRGSFFLAQRTANELIKAAQGGRILLMSSVTGLQFHPNLAAYGMTKAALRMLARSLGAELAQHGITVNCIAPGATLTERTVEDSDYADTWSAITPTGRASTPDDIAAAACFLLSSEAAQITGQTLVVDGGWTLTSPTKE